MSDHNDLAIAAAVSDFRRLRRRAAMERLLAGLRGQSADLLSFEEVRRQLRATAVSARQLREIALDAIVGSVGRYQDFSRSFLPRNNADATRWATVMVAANGLVGLPPIDVYQIGEVYFVLDGNHRVSVARQNGATSIQAHVIPFRSRVTITPDVQPVDLVLHAEYTDFLEDTRLDETRPDSDLRLTEPGQYARLREHIAVHQYFLDEERATPTTLEEAAADFYDRVYAPVVALIRERGLLEEFPGRTETDLYLWLAEHRAELESQLGWAISPEQAAANLPARQPLPARAGEQLLDMLVPDGLAPSPPPGAWRRGRPPERELWLFDELLVPISGEPAGWEAVAQALTIASRERARLLGLHVVRDEAQLTGEPAQSLRAAFERRCAEAGVEGRLALAAGNVARTIRERSRWADLVVLQISYPPGPGPLARLQSGMHTLIRTAVRPVLTVPRAVSSVERILLAYDGSPKAEEALVLAAYLAARWGLALAVITVAEPRRPDVEGARLRARGYLAAQGVPATLLTGSGAPGPAIVAAAERSNSQLIVLGGQGHGPVGDLLLSSTVEEVLRTSRLPTLICP